MAILFGVVAGVLALTKVATFPLYYNDRIQGCTIPDQPYKGHGAPEPNADVAFTLMSANGSVVSEWVPGEEYTVELAAYDDVVNAWVHTTGGQVTAPMGFSPADSCTEPDAAMFTEAPAAGPFSFTWVAPSEPICVIVSSAQATGPTANYQTGMATLCAEGAGPDARIPAGDAASGASAPEPSGNAGDPLTGAAAAVLSAATLAVGVALL